MGERRALTIEGLDRVMPEVDRLLEGHETVGKWSLGQICNHLAETIRYSVEGFPMVLPWPVRMIVGPIARREVLGKGRMRAGLKIPEKYAPRPGLDARAEAEALRASIAYYRSHPERRALNPILGRITPEEWDRLHCVHCAHHLSFVLPA